MLLMGKLEASVQQRVVQEMYERKVSAGEILIKEGDTGLAASELYVVKEGEFEVLERRQGVNFRVNMKNRGDCFGEISLMYSSPRSATVAATQDSTVWVLERDTFRLPNHLINKQLTLSLQSTCVFSPPFCPVCCGSNHNIMALLVLVSPVQQPTSLDSSHA